MPTYSYICKACEHGFEILQSFSEEALIKCPKCEGELRKQFGNLGVSFKGSGFYRTDSQPSPAPAAPASGD